MSISAGISIILYYLVFLIYYHHLLSSSRKRLWRIGPALLLIIGGYFAVQRTALPWLQLPALFIAMAIGGYLSSSMSFIQAFYGAGVCTLSLYCFRGITTSIAGWVVQDICPGFMLDAQSYYRLTVLSLNIALLFFQIIRKTIITDQELLMFLKDPRSLKNVIAYELAAIPCLILLNQGRHHNPDARWFAGITLAGNGLILFMLVFSIYHSIKETQLLQYKISNQFMEEQLEIQLRYYNSYHKSTERFRKLKHDYLSVMRTLKVMLERGQEEAALSLIHETDESLQEFKAQNKEYSENTTLDAVLQDLAFNCKEHGIRLSCEVAVPRYTELTTLEELRIITNVTNNAVEACKKVSEEKRFINISSRNLDGWVMLVVINAFDGKISMEDGQFKSRKNQKEDHGLGFLIVKEIVESKGGFLMTQFDVEENTFEAKILIPRHMPVDAKARLTGKVV